MDNDEAAQFSDIWAKAFEEYEKNTKRPLLKQQSLRTLRTTQALFDDLKTQKDGFTDFLQKHPNLWRRLERTMIPIQLVGDAVQASIGGTEFSPVAAIFAATSFLIKAAKGVTEAYTSITDLLEKLTDFTDRLAEYAKSTIDAKLRRLITEILATLLEVFACSERLIKRGRVKEFARVAFLGKDDDVANGIWRLQKLVDSEGRYVAAKTYSAAQRLDKDLIESKRERVEERDKKVLTDALNSDALMKVAAIQAHNFSDQLPESGEWLKREKLYEAWLKEEEQTLWILGGPGTGKSFLASSIVSSLLQLHPQDPQQPSQVSVGYFYIKEDDAELRSLNIILKCLAYQLQINNAEYGTYLARVCASPEKIVTAAATWTNLFSNFFGSTEYGNNVAILVLDGIDEAPRKEREALFQLLCKMDDPFKLNRPRPRIQVLLIGRPDLRDDTIFIWEQPIIYIEVSATKTKDDIKDYIKDRVGRVRALKQAREPMAARLQLRKDIIKKLNAGADGMFLWVNLMLDQIYDMSRPSDIHEALSNAPKSLTKMIRRVFERLADDLRGFRRDDFNEILAWVTCAERPLTLSELDTILKLRPPIGEGVPDLEERLRGQFASFFVLTREDGKTTQELIELSSQKTQEASYAVGRGESDIPEDGSVVDVLPKYGASKDPSEREDSESGNDHDFDGSDSSSSDANLPPEVQASDIYDSDYSTTTIRFSHASIRDYLLRESNPKKREFPDDLGIGVDHGMAENYITLMCLRALIKEGPLPKLHQDADDETASGGHKIHEEEESEETTNSTAIAYIVDNLTSYASVHFLKHMNRLDATVLSLEDELFITLSLLQLFSDQNLIEDWISTQLRSGESISGLAIAWLGDDTNSLIIRSWFKNQLKTPHPHSFEALESMNRFASSTKELFRAAAIVYANRWLVSNFMEYHTRQYIWATNVWYTSGDECGDSAEMNTILSGGVTIDGLSPIRIRQLADIPNFPNNSSWHAHVANAMLLAGHNSAAIDGFLVAINLDNTNDIAMIGLAKCYSLHQDYESAIMWMHKSLAWSEYFMPWYQSYLWQTIALWNLELGKIAEAKVAAQEACRITPEEGTPLSAYILVLEADNDQEGLIECAESLKDRISNDTTDLLSGESLLVGALLANDALLETLGRAAKPAGKLNFVIEAARGAVEVAGRKLNRQDEANQRLLLASLLFRFTGDENEAVKLWELVLHSTESITRTGNFTAIRQEAIEHLSQVYFGRAIFAEEAHLDQSVWVSKLKNLSKAEKAEPPISTLRKFIATRMLGLWHHRHGQEEEAYNCVRVRILEALDALEDTNFYNHASGWFALAECLIKIGDRVNAEAAYAVTFQAIGCDACNDMDDVVVIDQREVLRQQESADQLVMVERPAYSDKIVVTDETPISNPLLPSISTAPLEDTDPSTESVTFSSSKSTLFYWDCDGQCRRSASEWKEIHVCEICQCSTCFCEECVVKLTAGDLDFRVCDPTHLFLSCATDKHRTQASAGNGELGRDFVIVDGKEVPMVAWLTGLRHFWKEPRNESKGQDD